ncbi:hypothetical protein DICPUDRAFT_85916 [Dictyostelium purpureum]|uniref:Rho-GAP domain-containing protein n=1 Tax=Dictyostelium purpureum TaxID=5786 RepID=F0Z875_DICPU|nr:uncharacterized protein DICPUDRAFT_85916 [Dictyostelium purpureum]EGC39848.1 hypothetical protein DICPUDRAFT_85916 [Dictyostelium purpureum]|eukprot:XP_003283599.1 hypothetical protein DICPUDRAFT_85916 [Dictyostelium purpureum]
MKKFNKVYTDTLVSVKEIMNKNKDNTLEFPDYTLKTKALEDLKLYSKDFSLKLNKQSKNNQSLIEENKIFSEQLVFYSSLFLNLNDESYNICDPLSNLFKLLSQLVQEIETCRNKFDQSISSKWLNQLQEFQKVDYKDSQLAKNRYDKARIQFDIASENFKNLRKKQNNNAERLLEAEDNLDFSTQQFSDIASESLNQMEEIIDKHNSESFESMCSSFSSYKEFFQKGLEICNSMEGELEKQKTNMNKYKQNLQEKKKLRSTVVQFEQSTNTVPAQQTPAAKGNTKVFGMNLSTITEREKSDIPSIIEKSLQFLSMEENITQEGIFRVSPNQRVLTELKNNVNAGFVTTLDGIDDAYLMSSFLKCFLREMPEPLFTFKLYQPLVNCVLEDEDECDKVKISEKIAGLIATLPRPNFILSKHLLSLLWKISTKSQKNKMTTSNLAVVIAPNILYPKVLDIRSLTNSNTTIEFMIANFTLIFNNPQILNLYNTNSSVSNTASSATASNPRHSTMVPPSLPARPQSVMFKQTPINVNVNNNNNPSGASPPHTPTKLSNSLPQLPHIPPKASNTTLSPQQAPALPPKNKRLSSSLQLPVQPQPQSSSSPSSPSSSPSPTPTGPNPLRSSTGSTQKPISNRVSMYLANSNSQNPPLPPKPNRNINTTLNNSNNSRLSSSAEISPPPLAPVELFETLEPSKKTPDNIKPETNWI